MRLHSVTVPPDCSCQAEKILILNRPRWTTRLAVVLGSGLAMSAAMVLSTWAVSHGLHDSLGMLSWMLGIGLLALAADNAGRRAAWQAGAGIALMALGWLCSRLAPEFGILAALLATVMLIESILHRAKNPV